MEKKFHLGQKQNICTGRTVPVGTCCWSRCLDQGLDPYCQSDFFLKEIWIWAINYSVLNIKVPLLCALYHVKCVCWEGLQLEEGRHVSCRTCSAGRHWFCCLGVGGGAVWLSVLNKWLWMRDLQEWLMTWEVLMCRESLWRLGVLAAALCPQLQKVESKADKAMEIESLLPPSSVVSSPCCCW